MYFKEKIIECGNSERNVFRLNYFTRATAAIEILESRRDRQAGKQTDRQTD